MDVRPTSTTVIANSKQFNIICNAPIVHPRSLQCPAALSMPSARCSRETSRFLRLFSFASTLRTRSTVHVLLATLMTWCVQEDAVPVCDGPTITNILESLQFASVSIDVYKQSRQLIGPPPLPPSLHFPPSAYPTRTHPFQLTHITSLSKCHHDNPQNVSATHPPVSRQLLTFHCSDSHSSHRTCGRARSTRSKENKSQRP